MVSRILIIHSDHRLIIVDPMPAVGSTAVGDGITARSVAPSPTSKDRGLTGFLV